MEHPHHGAATRSVTHPARDGSDMASETRSDAHRHSAKAHPQVALVRQLKQFADTRRLLEQHPELGSRLGGLLAGYAFGLAAGLRKAHADGTLVSLEWAGRKTMGKALIKAVDRIEKIIRDRRIAALITRQGLCIDPRLEGLEDTLAALREEGKRLTRFATPPRGRPLLSWREDFALEIARTLAGIGEMPTKARGGLFAKILEEAFAAVGEMPPGDFFRLLKRAADAVRRDNPPFLAAWEHEARKRRPRRRRQAARH
jgi:hypothetical protein